MVKFDYDLGKTESLQNTLLNRFAGSFLWTMRSDI